MPAPSAPPGPGRKCQLPAARTTAVPPPANTAENSPRRPPPRRWYSTSSHDSLPAPDSASVPDANPSTLNGRIHPSSRKALRRMAARVDRDTGARSIPAADDRPPATTPHPDRFMCAPARKGWLSRPWTIPDTDRLTTPGRRAKSSLSAAAQALSACDSSCRRAVILRLTSSAASQTYRVARRSSGTIWMLTSTAVLVQRTAFAGQPWSYRMSSNVAMTTFATP